jgi:hypothetical protein
VLLTGTPSGCALRVPPPMVRRLLQLLPERKFWNLFVAAQNRRPEYLQPGDRVTATIHSPDGTLDLGKQWRSASQLTTRTEPTESSTSKSMLETSVGIKLKVGLF